MKKILIATVTAGGGHLQAAAALEEAWRRLAPGDRVKRVDVLDYTPVLYRNAYSRGYVKLIERAPELYARIFRHSDDPDLMRKLTRVRRWTARFAAPGFVREVRRFAPDAVLCPHFLPLEVLGSVSHWKSRRPFIASVITDFEAHALWMEPCVDQYFVAAPETGARLIARGVPGKMVSVTGIPVSQRFRSRAGGREARRSLGLDPAFPTVLVLGGGFGMGPVRNIVESLQKARKPVQALVVAGKNEALRRSLEALPHRHPTRVFGFVDDMERLMSASDLLITKPGGLTSSEALALGKPLMIVDPIPGQEAANSDYLLEHGAAVKVNRLEDLPFRIDALLGTSRLKTLAATARRLGRPRAAEAVCRMVMRLSANGWSGLNEQGKGNRRLDKGARGPRQSSGGVTRI